MKNYIAPILEVVFVESEDILFSSGLNREDSNVIGEGAGEIW